jgi:hypothetical protein
MTQRGKDDAVIRDPAFAAAAGKCWLARMMGGKVGSVVADHPEECSFCEFDPEYLIDRIEEFLRWAGLDAVDEIKRGEPEVRPLRATVEAFQMMGAEEQRRLVRKAQGQGVSDVERPADLYR